MINLPIKPLSVNRAYKGRKYPTDELKSYKKAIPLLLPSHLQLPPGELVLLFRFHFKRKASDVDNCCKAAQDIITNHYGVDDREIFMTINEKIINPKEPERLEFEFLSYHSGMFDACRELIINTDK